MRYTKSCPVCGECDWMYLIEVFDGRCKWVTGKETKPIIAETHWQLRGLRESKRAFLNVCQCGLVVS
jgi:hypothetical protein